MKKFLKQICQFFKELFTAYPILFLPLVTILFYLVPITWNGLNETQNSWMVINPPPARPVNILAVEIQGFYMFRLLVKGENDQVYSITTFPGVWSEVAEKIETDHPTCQLSKIQSWKKPFSDPFQCVEISGFGEFTPSPEYTVALDQNGELWLWTQEYNSFLVCIPDSLVCAGVGFLIGLFLSIYTWFKYRNQSFNND